MLKLLRSYPYQKDIIERVLSTYSNVLIMLPTGGGKTHIASEIASRSKKVLFIAPKLNLVDQTMESFSHLDPQLIHSTSDYDKSKKVFVSTIQTISRRPELLTEMEFDTIIIDEVHFGDSGKMQKVIKSNHTGRFIGLSATPYDSQGKLLEGYDEVIDKYDMKYLIDNKYLTTVEAVCPLNVDLKGVKITAGDYNLKELDDRMSSPQMITIVVDVTADILKEKKKTIIFCVSTEHAEKLAKAYRKVLRAKGIKKNIKTLHSKIDKYKDKRKQILKDFVSGNLDILISVDMITTGFNAPPTDSMVIARPTKSQNLYKQMVGRGTRNFKGKKYCLMIDCGNVVQNLGMPLDPIRPIKKKGLGIKKELKLCPVCRSMKPKKIMADGKGGLIKVCSVCGEDKEEYDGNQINKCPKCTFMHTYTIHKKQYIINQFGIALNCKGCNAIDPLAFFKLKTGSFLNSDYGVGEVLTEHILAEKIIFFEKCFIGHSTAIVKKKEKTYTRILFGKKKIDADEVYKGILDEVDHDSYMRCISQLSVFDLRKLFINFCYSYTKKPDLDKRIFKIEEMYFKKYNNYMSAEMYKKVAVSHVNFFSKEQNK